MYHKLSVLDDQWIWAVFSVVLIVNVSWQDLWHSLQIGSEWGGPIPLHVLCETPPSLWKWAWFTCCLHLLLLWSLALSWCPSTHPNESHAALFWGFSDSHGLSVKLVVEFCENCQVVSVSHLNHHPLSCCFSFFLPSFCPSKNPLLSAYTPLECLLSQSFSLFKWLAKLTWLVTS